MRRWFSSARAARLARRHSALLPSPLDHPTARPPLAHHSYARHCAAGRPAARTTRVNAIRVTATGYMPPLTSVL